MKLNINTKPSSLILLTAAMTVMNLNPAHADIKGNGYEPAPIQQGPVSQAPVSRFPQYPTPPVTIGSVRLDYAPQQYMDLIGRCSNYVSDLVAIQTRASWVARRGNLKGAADIIEAGLRNKASVLTDVEFDSIAPHTQTAIKVSYHIVNVTNNALAEVSAPGRRAVSAQLRYVMFNELVNLIVSANSDLDSTYFRPFIQRCYSGCNPYYGQGGSYDLPWEYSEHVAELAAKFINLQSKMSRVQAFDRVELNISEAVASAAKHILATSLYRREYACEITRLHNLEYEVGGYLRNSSGIPSYEFVDYVRDQFSAIDIVPTRGGGCYGNY